MTGGADADVCNELMNAIRSGDYPLAKFLIDAGADVNINEPLIMAIKRGGQFVKLLLSAGADVNRGSPLRTAMACGAEGEVVEIVKMLVDAGANVKDDDDDFPFPLLHMAMCPANTKMFKINIQIFKILLEAGADVNAKHLSGRTVMEMAKYKNYTAFIEILTAASG